MKMWYSYIIILMILLVYKLGEASTLTIPKQPVKVAQWEYIKGGLIHTITRVDIPEDNVSCYIYSSPAVGLPMSCVSRNKQAFFHE